jgi:hypothetical protein
LLPRESRASSPREKAKIDQTLAEQEKRVDVVNEIRKSGHNGTQKRCKNKKGNRIDSRRPWKL